MQEVQELLIKLSTLMIREILWRIFQSESNEPEALYLNTGFEGI